MAGRDGGGGDSGAVAAVLRCESQDVVDGEWGQIGGKLLCFGGAEVGFCAKDTAIRAGVTQSPPGLGCGWRAVRSVMPTCLVCGWGAMLSPMPVHLGSVWGSMCSPVFGVWFGGDALTNACWFGICLGFDVLTSVWDVVGG